MRDLMIDIETLGTAPGSVILSIGAVSFDAETGALGNEFYEAIEAQSAVAAGLTMDVGTIGWWIAQSQEAQQAAFAGDLPISAALYTFSCFVQRVKATRIWAKPPSFDLVLLESAFRACNMQTPWHYRATRDVRTLLDIAGTRHPYIGTAHNALDDAKSQALGVIEAYGIIAECIAPAQSAPASSLSGPEATRR